MGYRLGKKNVNKPEEIKRKCPMGFN